jgi:hypothetical protein
VIAGIWQRQILTADERGSSRIAIEPKLGFQITRSPDHPITRFVIPLPGQSVH